MADFGIGEMLLADAAGEGAIADAVGLSTADLIGSGAVSGAGAAGAAGALSAADLVGSGVIPAVSDLGTTVASGAFDGAGFEGISGLGQEVVDPVTRAIQAGNMANVTGDPMLQKAAFEGASPFQAPTTWNDYQDVSQLVQDAPQGIDQLQQVGQNVGQGVSQTAMDTQKLAEMGVKPIGMAPPGASLGSVLPNGSVVGPNGMLYNGAQVAQGLSGTLEAPSGISKLLAGSSMGIPNKYLAMAGTAAVAPLVKQALAPNPRYGINTPQPYSGPLSKFSYNPTTYTPAANPAPVYYKAHYVAGGTAKSNPMSDLMSSRDSIDKYLTEYQSDPASVHQKAKAGDYNAMLALNKIHATPNENYASGGITQLAVGGKLLRGQGDGMSDSIQANISGKRQARLADGEFVVPADVVSHLGNGSTDAGAKQLYSMMDKVRNARTGRKSQGRQITPQKYMPA